MSNQRVRLNVTGKVQGVFFRQSLRVMAIKNNVSGWVRNLDDNRVEAVLEGDEDNINIIIQWARIGPSGSRVERVNTCHEKFIGEFLKFNVIY